MSRQRPTNIDRHHQVPSIPDPDLRGYLNGFVLGDYLYLVPHFNQNFFGKLTRVDMRDFTWLVELQAVSCGVATATAHARAHACANRTNKGPPTPPMLPT